MKLLCYGTALHKSKELKVPENVSLLHIPPYTAELNPMEQIWNQLRSMESRNEIFKTPEHVFDRLCGTIRKLTNDTVCSVTAGQWIADAFLIEYYYAAMTASASDMVKDLAPVQKAMASSRRLSVSPRISSSS